MTTRLASRLLAVAVLASAPAAHADVDSLGQFTQSFDVTAPPFHGLTPAISLHYRSGGGNGLTGVGWSLAASSQIARVSRTHGVARMDASDVYLLDGEELIPCAAGSTSPSCSSAVATVGSSSGFYSTRVESFRRIGFMFNAFVVWDTDGTRSIYQSHDGGYTYLLAQQIDPHSNTVNYNYACTTTCVLDSITYPGTTIQLYREARPDPVILPNRQSLSQRLHSITITENGSLLRAYRLAYTQSQANGASLLSSVQQVGNDATVDASGNITGGTALPAVTFSSPSMTSAGTGPAVSAVTTPDLSQYPATNVAPLPARFANEQVRYNLGQHWSALAGDFIPNPYGVIVGDFDGDGRADWLSWVTQNNSCTTVETQMILETKGAHQAMVTWDSPSGLSMFDCSSHVWAADVDGDHRDDLLVYGQGHLSVLFSQGNGTFVPTSVGPSWSSDVKRCATGDFDGDGRDDIACTTPNGSTDQLVVARSPALNLWTTSVDQSLGLGSTNLIAGGDVNADGLSDLVIANLVNGQWVLWTGLSRGDGTFYWTSQATAWRYNLYDTDELALADLDGDAKADVVFNCKIPSAGDELFVGLATKGNSARFQLQAGFMPSWLENAEFGDYDGDGKVDLYLASSYRWAHGHGDGTFDAPVASAQSLTCMPFVGDLNGDRRSDVLCVGDDNNGLFTLADQPSPIVRGDLQHWMSADVTGDGVPDLVYVRYANPGYEISVVPSGATSPVASYFAPSTTQPYLDEPDAARFMLVDVGGPNGVPDGRADLVLISTNGSSLDVDTFLSTGTGTFTARHDQPWRPNGTVAPYAPVDLQNWRPADLDGNGTTDFVHFTTSGYGLHVDYLRSRGDGTFTSGQQDYFTNAFPSHSADMLATDVNGDGISDFVFAQPGYDSTGKPTSSGTVYTLVNNADGTFMPISTSGMWITPDAHNMRAADLDGDGLSDLVHVSTTVGSATVSYLNLDEYVSDGKGGWTYRFERASNIANNPREYNLLEDTELAHFVDVDGDGRADLLHVSSYYDGGPKLALVIATAASGWQVTKLEGPAIASTYDNRPWRWQGATDLASGGLALQSITPLSSPQIVLARPTDRMTHVDNGVGGTTDVEYTTLTGGRTYLPEGVLPRVVSAVTAGDHAAPQASSERMTYTFSSANFSTVTRRPLGFGYRRVQDHNSQRVTINRVDDACGAMVYEQFIQDLPGNTLALDVYTPINEGTAAPYTCMTYDHARYTCAPGGTCALRTDTTLTFDVYGNTTATSETATGTFNKLVQTPTATPNLNVYLVDLPASKQTYQYENSTWNLKASQAYAYDGSAGVGAVGAKGELSEVRTWDGQNTLLTDYQYTPSGLVSVEQTPTGTTTTTYDTSYGLYPTMVTVGPLPWGNLTTTHGYDLNTGLETWTADANGATVRTTYDALGRAIRIDRPDGTYTTTTYSLAGGHRVEHTASSDGSADGVWTEAWLDGLGRTFHTVRKDGASQDTVFTDATNLPASVSNIYVTPAAPVGSVTYTYDALGRMLVRRDTDGSTRTSTYGTSTVTDYDQNGKPRTATFDGRGAVNRVDEYNQGTSGATIYLHDVFGHLTRITDAAGNVSSYTYDPLGRITVATNPDRGTQQTFYKTNGLVDYTVDAMGNRISFTYDAIGRTTERDEIGPANGMRTVKLDYDVDSAGGFVANGLGRLIMATDTQPSASLSEAYTYDLMGRATSTQRCVGATCMTTQQTFDSAGRLATLTYPDSEVVTYGYDLMGRQTSLSGYATATYNEVDQMKTLAYANGQTTTNTYDPARHWLNSVNVTLPPVRLGFGYVTPRQYTATYAHESTARITSLALVNAGTSVNLAYTYDDLGRLTGVSSDAAHTESFTYDVLGRMTTSSYHGGLHYNDPLHVHAPTHADVGDDRTYDRDGNVIGLSDHGGRNLALAWTPAGQLASVRDIASGTQTAFVYDRNGDRVAKLGSVPDLYFGGLVELRNGVLTKYYTLGGKLVAKNDGAISYYIQDHRGSTRLVTNASHTVLDTYDYSAFGRSIAKSETATNDLEMGGGRFDDESALVFMNARYYDPELAHFSSADTIIPNVNDPQSMHRYSYTQQDPINFNDPSGHLRMQVEWKKDLDAQALRTDTMMNRCDSWDGAASLGCLVLANGLADQYNAAAAEDDMDWELVATETHERYYKQVRAYQEWQWRIGMAQLDAANAKNNAPAAKVEESTVNIRVAGEQVTNSKGEAAVAQGGLVDSSSEKRGISLLDRIEYVADEIKQTYRDIMAIPHDAFVFGGIEEEAKLPFLRVKIGQTSELLYLAGTSNKTDWYTEAIAAHGASVNFTVMGEEAYIGAYCALSLENHPSADPKPGVFVEGAIGDAYAGGFSFGGDFWKDDGLYAGFRFGNLFVGGGATFATFNWPSQAFVVGVDHATKLYGHFFGSN